MLRSKLNIETHIILFILSAVFLIAGLGEKIAYSNYDTECTAETTGIITDVKKTSGFHGRSSYKRKGVFHGGGRQRIQLQNTVNF